MTHIHLPRLAEYKPTCRIKTGKGHKLDISLAIRNRFLGMTDRNPSLDKSVTHLFQSPDWRIVVLAQMSQEYIFEPGIDYLLQKGCGVAVVEMSVSRAYSRFQILRITSESQHVGIIVSLYHKIVGHTHIVPRTVCDSAEIGGKDKSMPFEIDREAHIVRTVMRHIEGGDLHIGHFKRDLLEYGGMIFLYALGYAVATQKPVQNAGSAIQGKMPVVAQQTVGVAHVVAMVMGKDKSLDVTHRHAMVMKYILDRAGANAGIYHYAAPVVADITAVAA